MKPTQPSAVMAKLASRLRSRNATSFPRISGAEPSRPWTRTKTAGGDQTQRTDDEERHVPAERIPNPRSQGNTEHVCKGEACEHLPDGLPREFVRNEPRRHNRADPIKRSLRQACDYAADEKQSVVRRDGADQIAGDE